MAIVDDKRLLDIVGYSGRRPVSVVFVHTNTVKPSCAISAAYIARRDVWLKHAGGALGAVVAVSGIAESDQDLTETIELASAARTIRLTLQHLRHDGSFGMFVFHGRGHFQADDLARSRYFAGREAEIAISWTSRYSWPCDSFSALTERWTRALNLRPKRCGYPEMRAARRMVGLGLC